MNKMIEALLIEREGYLRRGKRERVAAVDQALSELGYEHDFRETATVEPTETAVVKKAVRKRKI